MLYHHAKRETTVVQDKAQEAAETARGYVREPFPPADDAPPHAKSRGRQRQAVKRKRVKKWTARIKPVRSHRSLRQGR